MAAPASHPYLQQLYAAAAQQQVNTNVNINVNIKHIIKMKTHQQISTMPLQQAAYGLTPNIMQLAGLQGGTGNPLLDMYSQYAAAAYSPQVGLHCFSFLRLSSFSTLTKLLVYYFSLSKWSQPSPKPLP